MASAKRRLEAEKKIELAVEKENRLEKIREAKAVLEQQAKQKAEAEGKNPEEARPDPKAQRNFTDPDSRIMPKEKTFVQAYNAQLAVDADTQLITAELVTQATTDANNLEPMVLQTIENTGLCPKQVSADTGYCCQADIEKTEALGTECLVPPRRFKHGTELPPAPRGRMPAKLSFRERMHRKLLTKRGRAAYARRKVTVEPVNGQLKNGTLPRFSLRGLFKVRGEFSLACAVHNLKKLWRMDRELPALA
jgi:DDE family transposase